MSWSTRYPEAVQNHQSRLVELVVHPGKNGLEVVQAIREIDKDVTIMMVTTEGEKARVIEAIQAGVNDYLVKPFTAEMLRDKLEKHGC